MNKLELFSFTAIIAALLTFSATTSRAAIIYENDFEDAGETAGFVDGGGSFVAVDRDTTAGVDFEINGGGASTVRTGANTSAFAAGSIVGPGSLKFSVIQRMRDRETFASIVDASGNHLLAIGNTDGTAALANNQDPLGFAVIDNTDTAVATFPNGTGGITLSGSSLYIALQVEVDLATGAGTLRAEDLGGDATASASGSYIDLGSFTLSSAAVSSLANGTGIGAGQSGGGTAFDEFVVSVNPVPEPKGICLLTVGLLAFVGKRRRNS